MDDLPLPPQIPTQALPAGIIEQIDKYLSNPLFQIAAKGHTQEIQEFIKSNSGEFEPLVYEYINTKYPNIYNIIKKDEVMPEGEDDQEDNEPINKPVPQAAITYEILELHKELYTPSEIADFLSEKYDINLYPMHVGRIIKRAQAAPAAPKPPISTQEAPRLTQDVRSLDKPVIDQDTHLVMTTAANIINFWNHIKLYVYMTGATVAGILIDRLIILR